MMRFTLPLLLIACGAGPAEDDLCLPGDAPTLEIGEGTSGYEPLADGDEITLVHGPQGGYHIELGLLATGVAADDLISGSFEGRIDGALLATSKPWLDLRCDSGKGRVSFGTQLIFDAQPEELHDRDAEITAEITDLDGTVVSATRVLHIWDPLLAE